MGVSYRDILRIMLGPDSGWRVRGAPTKLFKFSFLGILDAESVELAVSNRHGMDLSYTMRSLGAGLPCPIEANGLDSVQGLVPGLLNKILCGPMGRARVVESDIRGLFGALSLGLSTEDAENVTMVWFGDWGTSLSTLVAVAPQISVAAQMGLATAVAIIPSGDAGMKFTKGHVW